MNETEMIAKTVAAYLTKADKDLQAIRAQISDSFKLGYDIDTFSMERLMEAQAAFRLWTAINKLVVRGVEQGNLDELLVGKKEEMMESLLLQGAGGSTSAASNAKTEIDRKVMLRVYQAVIGF